jgi:PAS domain S-box-containing protein
MMSRRPRKQQAVKTTPHYASEKLYKLLFEQAADGIFIADTRGRYVEVNWRGCEILDYTRKEMLDLSIEDLNPTEDLVVDPLRLADLRAGQIVLSERHSHCKDGRLLPVEINVRMLSDGNFLGMVREINYRFCPRQRRWF